MKRGALSLVAVVTLGVMAVACAPAKEPKQAAAPDPTEEGASSDSSSSSGASGSSSSASNGGGDGIIVPPPGGASGGAASAAKAGGKGEAPSVSSLTAMQDGLKWGMSHADVVKVYTQTGGVIWKDYDEKLAKARVGPEMTALEAERETQKAAFGRSFIEFKDTPTGYDATGIKSEYTYKNREALMWVQRQGKKRYFFFINDRLWKVYDEVPLGDSGQMGKSFVEAVNLMNGKLGAAGRIQGADAAKGINTTTVDWKDSSTHLRLVDRSGERLVGVVVEDNSTLNSLASLRTNKSEDPTAIDPTIAAVTKGGLSDPNAAQPAGASSAKPDNKKAPPKKK